MSNPHDGEGQRGKGSGGSGQPPSVDGNRRQTGNERDCDRHRSDRVPTTGREGVGVFGWPVGTAVRSGEER
ncbi:MAG: hypothetical protein LC777_02525 [Actinobacteria bacterium]|nr:hypothetical protein [Actinomycetota bacterium]